MSEGAVNGLAGLPDDVLERIGSVVVSDLAGGVAHLSALAASCRRLWAVFTAAGFVSRLAAERGVSGLSSLEGLAVLETVTGLGTNRIYFMDAQCIFRPGSSLERLNEYEALLRRHPRLILRIEGHTGSRAPDGAARRFSYQRTVAIGEYLLRRARGHHYSSSHSASEVQAGQEDGISTLGIRGHTSADARSLDKALSCEPASQSCARERSRLYPADHPIAHRVFLRAWGKAVAVCAQWAAGIESRHAEAYFEFDGVEMPARPACYEIAAFTDQSVASASDWPPQSISLAVALGHPAVLRLEEVEHRIAALSM